MKIENSGRTLLRNLSDLLNSHINLNPKLIDSNPSADRVNIPDVEEDEDDNIANLVKNIQKQTKEAAKKKLEMPVTKEEPDTEDTEIHNTLIDHRDDIQTLLPNSPNLMYQLSRSQEQQLVTTFKHTMTFAKGLEHKHLSTQPDSLAALQTIIKLIGSHLPHISTPLERTRLLNQIHQLSLEKGLPADLKQTLQQITQQKGQLPFATFLNKPVPPLNE